MRHNAGVSILLLATLMACSPTGGSPPATAMAEPTLNPPGGLPSGMVLPPIVDPDQAGPPYVRGQAVKVDGVTIVYEGTSRVGGRYTTRFRVTGDLPTPLGALFVLPNGPSAELSQVGDVVTSAPFALADAEPTTLFSWRIGSRTIVWELGQTQS